MESMAARATALRVAMEAKCR